VALRLCYNYYLMKCSECTEMEEITNVANLKWFFFPTGLRASDTSMTVSSILAQGNISLVGE